MDAKKRIAIYEDKNGPYMESLRQGLIDTPEERFIKFFEQRRKFKEMMGIQKDYGAKKQIVFKVVSWIR